MADPVPPTPGPRRIRSRPDRPVRGGAGGVRSTPDRLTSSTRLPGTDAASCGGDMNWRRGAVVLWILFGLIAAGEAFLLAVYLLAGGAHWPQFTDVVRLTVLCGVFASLWFGWGWTRWVLAAVAFLAGLRTVALILVTSGYGAGAEYLTSSEILGSLIYTGILACIGALYLALSAYLIFSADVFAFTQHRRQEGRAWVALPVALVLGVYWITMLGGDFALRRWLASMQPEMQQLADNDVRTMAAGWDPVSLAGVLDEEALQTWPMAGREEFMRTARPLGAYLVSSDAKSRSTFYYDSIKKTVMVHGDYQEVARCANGHTAFTFSLTRPLRGRWKVYRLSVGEFEFYDSPAPVPAATATPARTPVLSVGG